MFPTLDMASAEPVRTVAEAPLSDGTEAARGPPRRDGPPLTHV
jgi:hypothetical protein